MNTITLKTGTACPVYQHSSEPLAVKTAVQESEASPLVGLPGTTLVLGGARSGKSRYAEALITALPPPWVYLATGRAFDAEMQERIAHHRASRPEGWCTEEEPFAVADVLRAHASRPVLLDCLTLWLTNLLLAERNIPEATQALLAALEERRAPTVLVGNEVGLGIVPEHKLARQFRDEAGILHQRLAAQVGKVVFIAAGLPLVLKERPPG